MELHLSKVLQLSFGVLMFCLQWMLSQTVSFYDNGNRCKTVHRSKLNVVDHAQPQTVSVSQPPQPGPTPSTGLGRAGMEGSTQL